MSSTLDSGVSSTLDSGWDEIRRQFSSDLYKPCAEKNNFHTFTACADLEQADNLCHIAKCLVGPVKYLKKMVGFQWLTVVQYDPTASAHNVHDKHLNFYVAKNLQDIFLEEKNRMFLMTGVACGLPRYRPIKNNIEVASLPMFELRYTIKPGPAVKPQDRIVFEISSDGVIYCCDQDLPDCLVCPKNKNEVIITTPPKWEKYVKAIPILSNNDDTKKLLRTFYNFVSKYPAKATDLKSINGYSALFIPGVHVPGYPYYVNGVLIAFNSVVDENKLNLIRCWTEDVCRLLIGSVLFQSKRLHGPWMMGTGEESEDYFDAYAFNCKDGRVESNIKGTCNQELKQLLGAGLPGNPEWHDILDNTALPDEVTTRLLNGDKDTFETFEKKFPSWIAWVGELGVKNQRKAAVAYAAFTLLNNEGTIHLLALLAFCKDAGFDVTPQTSFLGKIKKNTIWHNSDIKLDAKFVLKMLVYESGKLIKDGGAKCSADVSTTDKEIIFCMEIELPCTKEEDTEKKIYLDWLSVGKLEKHLLTRTILAAEQLGRPDGYLDVRPVWDGTKVETPKLVEHWKSNNKNGALVVLEKANARIIVKKTWGA